MQLSNILSRIDDIESNQPTIKQYVVESTFSSNEMAKHWRKLDEGFFKGYTTYLQEVALQPDQIQDIFKQAQASADAGGDNSTMLGKIFDKIMPAKQASAFADSLPDANAGPVDGFEQKAQSSIDSLQADPQTKQGLMGMIKAGMQKPESQQLILAAVGGGLSGLIGKVGPLLNMVPGGGTMAAAITGAVIAGGVAVATAKLQGKDWKTAFKGAIKPALMGGAAAVIGQMAAGAMASAAGKVGDSLSGAGDQASGGQVPADMAKGMAADQAFQDSMIKKFPPDQGYTFGASGDSLQVFDATGRKVFTGDIPLNTMDMRQFADLTNNGQMATPGTTSGAVSSDPMAGVSDTSSKRGDSGWNSMKANTNPDGSPMTLDQINAAKDALRSGNATAIDPSTPSDGSYKQAAPLGRDGLPMRQTFESNILPAAIIYKTLHRASLQTIQMNEGIGSWLKTKASNMTKSVTADKLQSAWKAAGSPTDSDALAKVLQDSGVSPEIVNSVYTQLQIPAPQSVNTSDPLADIQAQIANLDPASQKELLAYLQK
jgi:hypothetical protein